MSINRETDASAINRNFNDLLEKGAEYSDIRVFPHDRRETFLLENGCLEVNDSQDYCGIGVRVLYQGAWGFAADSRSDQIDLCFQQAFRNAQAASQLISAPLCMKSTKPVQPLNGSYSSPVQTPYDSVSLKEKIELLHEIDAILTESWIRKRMIRLRCLQRDVLFCNTEGTRIERKLSHVFAVATGFALDKDDSMQRRSHTLSTTGKGTRGWELVLSPQHFRDKILILKDDLRQLCTAPELEPGPRSLILLPGQGFLQLHETIGHPLELDRILGYELSYAGGSFVTLNDFGSLRYGSEKLTVSIFDGIENSPGTFGYDDEGSAQHTYLLIDKGILVNAISSRSSIALANQYAGKQLFTASGATARANNFYRAPLERMSNLNIRPGTDGTLADIIASTENGLIMDNPVSWSIGSNREHFHFSCELAWEVKNGQKTGIVKNASYQGHTLQLYNNLSAVGDASTWQVEQVDNCGKGEPNQEIELGHGVPVLKFENVVCGEVR